MSFDTYKEFDLIQFLHESTKRNNYFIPEPPNFNTQPIKIKEYFDAKKVYLKNGPFHIKVTIEDAILKRRSKRVFTNRSLSLLQLSKILWLSLGITGKFTFENIELPLRSFPSAGGLYPTEIYPVILNVKGIESGIYHYSYLDHSLEFLKAGDFMDELSKLCARQYHINGSNVCLIFSSVLERTIWKYGGRGYRYALLEAGHISQNICLISTSMHLHSLPIGGFSDNAIANLIGIDPDNEPVMYMIAIGTGTK